MHSRSMGYGWTCFENHTLSKWKYIPSSKMYRKSPKHDKGSQCVKMGFLWGWGGWGWVGGGLDIFIKKWFENFDLGTQKQPKWSNSSCFGRIKILRRLFNENTLKSKTLDLENVGWWREGDVGEFVQFAGGVLERQVIGARCHQINAGDVFTHGYWGLPLAPLKEIRKGKQFGKDHLHGGWYVESP